jgi:hypothetical protein
MLIELVRASATRVVFAFPSPLLSNAALVIRLNSEWTITG